MKKRSAVPVAELDASSRIRGFEEVVAGYTEEEAVREAKRCLQCKDPRCISGCPVNIDIKSFIGEIVKGDYASAFLKIKEKNNFPSICGRICPAEYQCRKACVLTSPDAAFAGKDSINIHLLERFAGDYGMSHNLRSSGAGKRSGLPSVAVIGSGPAGLSCAGELAREGIPVTVYEALHRLGGVLGYGIPPFRLPREIMDHEIDYLRELGVEFITDSVAGKTLTVDDIFAGGVKAVFVGVGAGIPKFLNIPGEDLCNVYSANEYLTRVNLMSAHKFPEFHTPVNAGRKTVVIGAGNTAMDAARVSVRMQAVKGNVPDTVIVYRRTENEMPARRMEIDHAREEGVKFDLLTQPVEFLGDERGYLKGLRCVRCSLGAPDASGRQRPVPIENSEFVIDCDVAIIAAGLLPNTLLTSVTKDLKVDKRGKLMVDPVTMETSMKGVYAGGDIVGGEGTVIEAMGMGKAASRAIKTFCLGD